MTVVADTSTLCYLVLLGCPELLRQLYGQIHVPLAVRAELLHADAPAPVRDWAAHWPDWIQVHPVAPSDDAALARLHAGEREAILLATTLRADAVLLDEKAARAIAEQRNLSVAGLLGVLLEASRRGLVDLPAAIDQLRQTTFRASPQLLREVLRRHAEGR